MTENISQFHCGYASASESGGDHFQVLFAKTQDSGEDEGSETIIDIDIGSFLCSAATHAASLAPAGLFPVP